MDSNREQDMAKRSDFAQKLLDDLRLRKERLAGSQRSNHTNSMVTADAYSTRNSKRTTVMKPQEPNHFHGGRKEIKFGGSNKSLSIRESSDKIVPFPRGRTSECIDLSMAFDFARQNGGKITRVDPSMLDFLHHIGKRSIEYGNMERRSILDRHRQPSSSQYLTVSNLHINEISKGAQKLNQILRICSEGFNLDKYSIEIGKELMKGAINLEESLWMLVNVQEASEYMTTSQRKNQIELLDEDEDKDDDYIVRVNEQKPKFSVDKHTRNHHGVRELSKTNNELRLEALTNPPGVNYNHRKQSLVNTNSSSRTGSARYDPDIKPLAMLQKNNRPNNLHKGAQKGRIPSVVAKLMGLEELPNNVTSECNKQKESDSKRKVKEIASNKTTKSSTVKAKHNTLETENLALAQNVRKKETQPSTKEAIDDLIMLKAGMKRHAQSSIFEEATLHKTVVPKFVDSNAEIQKEIRERKNQNIKQNVEKVIEKNERLSLAHVRNRGPNTAAAFQQKTQDQNRTSQAETIRANMVLLRTQEKPQDSLGSEQTPSYKKFEPQNQQRREGEPNSTKQKLQLKKQTRSPMIPNQLSKPVYGNVNLKKKHPETNQATASMKHSMAVGDTRQNKGSLTSKHQTDKPSNGNLTSSEVKVTKLENKHPNQNTPAKYLGAPMARDMKIEKEEQKVNGSELFQKVDEVRTKQSGGLHNLTLPAKQHSSFIQELKHRKQNNLTQYNKEGEQIRLNRSRETEVFISMSEKSAADNQLSEMRVQENIAKYPILHILKEDEFQTIQEPTDNGRKEILKVTNNQRHEESLGIREKQSVSHEVVSRTHEGYYASQQDQPKVSTLETGEPLTKSENNLKQIIIKSRIFLDTAGALFRLDIPCGTLHSGIRDFHHKDFRLMLDSSYDIMRRKGRLQELTIHPYGKLSINRVNIGSLDHLVKQLDKDIKKLNLYGREGNAESEMEDYLPKMVENDIQYTHPDVNCMWDIGWNSSMFAFIEKNEVVRDVERYMLNGLLDQITRDLLVCTI